MIFTDKQPETWVDLQNRVCSLLNGAGYKAVSPHEVETARGKVEVDVWVESPDVFVRKIVCECKFWNEHIPKEKIHAFRSVVSDLGASLGIFISKTGFQSGAIEAAKYSNVILYTWDDFANAIEAKWTIGQLKKLKKRAVRLWVYSDPLHFPFEKISEADKPKYISLVAEYSPLYQTCQMISRTDLLEAQYINGFYKLNEFTCVESYINFLLAKVEEGISKFEGVVESSNIDIPESAFEKLDSFTYMYLE